MYTKILNEFYFDGNEVFTSGPTFLGTHARDMVEFSITKQDVENAIERFWDRIGRQHGQMQFRWGPCIDDVDFDLWEFPDCGVD